MIFQRIRISGFVKGSLSLLAGLVLGLAIPVALEVAFVPRERDVDISNPCMRARFIQIVEGSGLQYTVNQKGWVVFRGEDLRRLEPVEAAFDDWAFGKQSSAEAERIIRECPRSLGYR